MKIKYCPSKTYFAPPNFETWLHALMWVNRGLLCSYTRILIRTHQRQLLVYGATAAEALPPKRIFDLVMKHKC